MAARPRKQRKTNQTFRKPVIETLMARQMFAADMMASAGDLALSQLEVTAPSNETAPTQAELEVSDDLLDAYSVPSDSDIKQELSSAIAQGNAHTNEDTSSLDMGIDDLSFEDESLPGKASDLVQSLVDAISGRNSVASTAVGMANSAQHNQLSQQVETALATIAGSFGVNDVDLQNLSPQLQRVRDKAIAILRDASDSRTFGGDGDERGTDVSTQIASLAQGGSAVTAQMQGAKLVVDGSAKSDFIVVKHDTSDQEIEVHVLTPGAESTFTFDTNEVKSIQVNGNDGNDKILFQRSINSLKIDGGMGNDVLAALPEVISQWNPSLSTVGQTANTESLALVGPSLAPSVANPTTGFDVSTNPFRLSVGIAQPATLKFNYQTCNGVVDLDHVLMGGAGNDVLIGSTSNDYTLGGAGNDWIFGFGGSDVILAGDGNDVVFAGKGQDHVDGGAGTDVVFGGQQDDCLHGGEGRDVVFGNRGNDSLWGNDGNDWLFGNRGDDSIRGGRGTDVIVGNRGNDRLDGEADRDFVLGNTGADLIEGGDGDDVLLGGDDNDTIRGNAGRDLMFGGEGDDRIEGGSDTDVAFGNRGNDHMFMGTGNDFAFGNRGNDVIYGEDGSDVLLGGQDRDSIYGNNGNDVMFGNSGDDYLSGGSGSDWGFGNTGNDHLRGGDHNDVLIGGLNNDTIHGDNGNDVLFGGSGNDAVHGDNGNDKAFGNRDNDVVTGGSGNDWLFGNSGNDNIKGGFRQRQDVRRFGQRPTARRIERRLHLRQLWQR